VSDPLGESPHPNGERHRPASEELAHPPRVLVTGAAGFIGSHLVEACLDRGWFVTAVDSLSDNYSPATKLRNCREFTGVPRCEWHQEDLCATHLDPLVSEADLIFHLAAQPGVRTSWGESFDRYTAANVTGLQRLLEAAKNAPIERFIFASSSSVYGDSAQLPTPEAAALRPISPYGATKAFGEHLCNVYRANYGVPVITLRYFTVYGPRQRPDMAFHRIIESAIRGEPITVYGDGNQRREFTYVADAIEGTIAAALIGTPGAVYNLGGGESASLNDTLSVVEGLLGTSLEVTRVENQHGDARVTSADIGRAANELGFAPRIGLREGLALQTDWHRSTCHLLADEALT
jgi:nucleoside-diphosphate-sugar epimerase